jgi:putative hemolysin
LDILILAVLILINGVFAMSEIALVTARRSRLARLAEDGDTSSVIAMRLGDEPTQFLSTVQIGITAIGILNGFVGKAALAEPLSAWLHSLGIDRQLSMTGASLLVVVGITYFTIVIGELVPKRIAQFNAEGIARLMARPIAALANLSRPFVYLLSVSTDAILGLMGKGDLSSAHLTEEDIHAVLAEGSETGVIEKQEHQMVRNVFRLDDRQIISLMTPRSGIVSLDVNLPLEQNLEKMIQSDHSRFPVCRGGLEDILGVVTAKNVLRQKLRGGAIDLSEQLEPGVYVPESLTGIKLLEQFRDTGVQMVFVVDEYGGMQGLVTLHDVLEALAGEFKPRNPADVWAFEREDGSLLLEGLTPIPELKDRLGLRTLPEEEKGRYHTLSGMMMWLIGHIPRTGDITEWERWRFEVVDMDGNRIDKVLATRQPEEEEGRIGEYPPVAPGGEQ